MTQKMKVNGDRYPTDGSRSTYLQTRVSGQAAQYLEGWLQGAPDNEITYDEIMEQLTIAYTNRNAKQLARKEYQDTKQGSSDVASFLQRFRALAVQAGISEEDQLIDVYQRLNPHIQRSLALYEPKSIAVFIIDITALDRRLTEANAGIDSSTNKKNNSRKPATGLVETEETIKKVYTRGERAPDQPWHTCYACGTKGHKADICTASDEQKAAHRKARANKLSGKGQPSSQS